MKRIINEKPNKTGPSVWVKKWVDYSTKYGLGYTLSNGTTGVYFNDNTKLLRGTSGKTVDYFHREAAQRVDTMVTFAINHHPKEINKKMLLMKHFHEYLEGKSNDEFQDELSPKAAENDNNLNNSPIFVKKWMRTKHAILFRLNNKVVQVCFQDNTEIIICSDSRLVTFVCKRGTRETFTLQEAVDSPDIEMTKRLKYAKDVV